MEEAYDTYDFTPYAFQPYDFSLRRQFSRRQSAVCPNNAMLLECPGSIFAAGLMKCTA